MRIAGGFRDDIPTGARVARAAQRAVGNAAGETVRTSDPAGPVAWVCRNGSERPFVRRETAEARVNKVRAGRRHRHAARLRDVPHHVCRVNY